MKKLIAIMLLLCSFAMVFAKGTTEATTASSVNPDDYKVTEKTEIEFWLNYSDKAKIAWFEDKVAKYNASQDLVTVNMIKFAGYNAVDEALIAAQAAGTGLPGVTIINVPRIMPYAESGLIERLDNYIEATNYNIDDVNEGMLGGCIYDPEDSIVALPWGITSAVCFWNMDLLKKAGYDKPFTTWDELVKAAPVIYEKTGALAYGMIAELNYVEVALRNAGVDPLGDSTQAKFDDPAIKSFLTQFKDLCDKGYARYYEGKNAANDQTTDFYNQNLVCLFNTSSITNATEKQAAANGFEIQATFPLQLAVKPAMSCLAGGNLIMPAINSQKVKNAAWDFMMYLLSEEVVVDWTIESSSWPALKSVYTNPATSKTIADKYPLFGSLFQYMDGIQPKNKALNQTKAYNIIDNAIGAYINGGADYDTTIKNANKELADLLADI